MALESAIFSQKVHIFRHQPIKFYYLQVKTLSTTYSPQNSKTTYYEPFQPISRGDSNVQISEVYRVSINLGEIF